MTKTNDNIWGLKQKSEVIVQIIQTHIWNVSVLCLLVQRLRCQELQTENQSDSRVLLNIRSCIIDPATSHPQILLINLIHAHFIFSIHTSLVMKICAEILERWATLYRRWFMRIGCITLKHVLKLDSGDKTQALQVTTQYRQTILKFTPHSPRPT